MTELRKSCVCVIVWILCQYECQARRACVNDSLAVSSMQLHLKYEEKVEGTSENFSLYSIVSWTLTSGNHSDFDGYLVQLMNPTARTEKYLTPSDDCQASNEKLWIKSQNESICDVENDTRNDCNTFQTSSSDIFLACGRKSSAAKDGVTFCSGSSLRLHKKMGFFSIPNTRESVKYQIEFNTNYQFRIVPYQRQWMKRSIIDIDIPANWFCADVIASTFNVHSIDARKKCCEQGAKSLVVHNITFLPSKPTFRASANQTTVEVVVTWLPPAIELQPVHYGILLLQQSNIDGKLEPEHTNITEIPLIYQSNSTGVGNCTYSPDYMLQMVMFNLVPGMPYLLEIHPRFNDTKLAEWCNGAVCRTRKYFTAHEVDDVCKEEYELCAPEAKCLLGFDPDTGRKAKCNCSSGLTGNGLNINIGEGCSEFNECDLNVTSCAIQAICVDIPAPHTGVNCTCREGYFGDGYASGSGCQSSALYALRIALPVVVLFILAIFLAILIIWYIKRKRHIQRKMLMEQYVPDDRGILASYEDSDVAKNEGPWDPTFGETWEIDRANINFKNVIGRGNYGIVHMAWLKKDWKKNGIIFKNEAAFKNGGSYDPVAPDENGAHVSNAAAEDLTLVAVKSLQEGNRNHANLYNFMAEIAFMLNIGKHENIVEIHGCSTTEEPVYLITEYLKYGDLLQFLWDAREPTKVETDSIYKVTERSLCVMARHVANGLTYLQSIRIIHGDIAARNILVGKEGICKISDFGLANDVYRYGAIKGHKERFVPFKWISPERMMSGEVPITYKSDVWSFGNLLYETFTLGCPPHPGIQSSDLLDKLKAGYRMKKPRTCNDEVYGLMDKCWKLSPASRPRFNQIVKTLDNVIEQLPCSGNEKNLAAAVEELDRQLYEKEVNEEIRMNDHIYINGHVAIVGNENENQTREM